MQKEAKIFNQSGHSGDNHGGPFGHAFVVICFSLGPLDPLRRDAVVKIFQGVQTLPNLGYDGVGPISWAPLRHERRGGCSALYVFVTKR